MLQIPRIYLYACLCICVRVHCVVHGTEYACLYRHAQQKQNKCEDCKNLMARLKSYWWCANIFFDALITFEEETSE